VFSSLFHAYSLGKVNIGDELRSLKMFEDEDIKLIIETDIFTLK